MIDFVRNVWEILNTPPAQSSIIEDNIGKLTKYIENKTIRFLFNLILSLIQFLEKIILTTPSRYIRTKQFWEVYHLMIYLSLAILAVVFLLIAIKKLKGDKINFELLLFKILAYPIFVILSPYFLLKAIDVFNRIAGLLISQSAIKVPELTTFSSILGIIIYLAVMIILSYRLIYFYAKRMVKIILFAVLSPVILASWCLPKYSHIVDNWIDYILGLLISQVIHALILLILGSIIMGVSEFNNMLSLVFQLGALGVMGEAEQIIGNLFGSSERLTPQSWQKQIKNWRKNTKTIKNGIKKGRNAYINIKAIRRFLGGLW